MLLSTLSSCIHVKAGHGSFVFGRSFNVGSVDQSWMTEGSLSFC